jgi:hypothetical protein
MGLCAYRFLLRLFSLTVSVITEKAPSLSSLSLCLAWKLQAFPPTAYAVPLSLTPNGLALDPGSWLAKLSVTTTLLLWATATGRCRS